MNKGNIAVFIPHLGCPHACVFCNQRFISGTAKVPTADEVRQLLKQAVLDREKAGSIVPCEIAFFGGSFTAIPIDDMTAYLNVAGEFSSYFEGIRLSTRPDCISREILELLKSKGVTDIELGVQSTDDRVLCLSGRGHTAEDTYCASGLIREYGIGLGHQMMTGLPGDTKEGAIQTARDIVSLSPDTVRIYPTLVLQGTDLDRQYREGTYIPQTLDEAVTLCTDLTTLFEENNIRVIRVGLHDDGVGQSLVAGPYHPAFGDLCAGYKYLQKAKTAIDKATAFTGVLRVAVGETSKMVGQKRCNMLALEELYGITCRVKEDAAVPPQCVKAE